MASVFLSYSHKDEDLRNAFEVHLAMLKRENAVSVWHDRKLLPGDSINETISRYLADADIVILLVSADFLASYYCYEKEMLTALDQHERGTSRVIPVILSPCDWQAAPFAKGLVTPRDGKPVVKWPSVDEAFVDVVQSIREVLKRDYAEAPIAAQVTLPPLGANVGGALEPRSSNLRIKSIFTQVDKDRFLDESYEFVKRFFTNSLETLKERHSDIDFRMRESGDESFSATLYRDGKDVSHCTIFLLSSYRSREIAYSAEIPERRNSPQMSFGVEADDQMLFLSGSFSMHHESERKLTMEGASEQFWAEFVKKVQ
jgi:hypothetical protein